LSHIYSSAQANTDAPRFTGFALLPHGLVPHSHTPRGPRGSRQNTRNVENEKRQIEEQKDLLKTFVDGDEEVMYSFLVAMELYICKELRKGISKFDKVMKKLWESDIISEDVADRWHGNEQALHEFYPEFQLEDAISIRESGLKFVEWVREGGD
jgi:hypothetical protein